MYQIDHIEHYSPYDQRKAQHVAKRATALGVPAPYVQAHLWELELPLYTTEQAARVLEAMYHENGASA